MTKSRNISGQVTLVNDSIVFKNVTVTDPVVVAEFKSAIASGAEATEFALALLEIGARTASLRSNTAGAEKLEASINQAKSAITETAKSLEDAVKKQVKDLADDDGLLIKGIQQLIDTYQDEVEELASGEESELRKAMLKLLREAKEEIAKDVKNTVDAQRKSIGELLDPSNPTSPLKPLASLVQGVSDSLNQMIHDSDKEVAVAEVLEAGIDGGNSYEEVAVSAVQKVAALAGDDCEHTGDVTGRVPKSKMGDGVVDLKVGGKVFGRLVLEAKNSSLTKKDWEKEIKGAKANRGATGFLGLCKHLKDMPNSSKLMIMDPQTIIIQFNPETEDLTFLALVYQIVKMNVLNNAGSLDGVDIADINMSLQDAISELDEFVQLKKNASAIENSAKAIKAQADKIKSGVQQKIGQIQQAIRAGLEPESLESTSSPREIED